MTVAIMALETLPLWGEEDPMSRRLPSRPDIRVEPDDTTSVDEQFEHWSAKELSIRAINATLALSQEVGKLAAAVAHLEMKLHDDYEDTKTHNLRTLEARDKWFKRIITGVVTAVAVAEVLRMLGLVHGG